jgi:hypothetical protein
VGEDSPDVKDKVDSDNYKKINDIAQKTNRPIKIGLPDTTDAIAAFENSMDLTSMYFKPDNKAFDLDNIDEDKTIIDVNSNVAPTADEITTVKSMPKEIDIDLHQNLDDKPNDS